MSLNINVEHPYGILMHEEDLKLQRGWFDEMVSLIGVTVIYRSPRPNKTWTRYSEIESNYNEPIALGCIFSEYPDQKTMKKLGWVAELDEQASIISVPYDTPNIQVGALFIVPSALDPKVGRLFRVTKMSTIMICPASVTCELVPEYEDTQSDDMYDHRHNSFNLLNQEEDYL